jgi:putative transposase
MEIGHRKLVRHFEQARHLHELTFSCFQRKPLLTNDLWRGLLGQSLQSACQDEDFLLIAFVFMPEHVHLLVLPQSSDSKVSRLLARTKQPFSKQIRELLESRGSPLLDQLTVQERPGKRCFRFWQEGPGFDRNLFSPAAIAASIDYIHLNPVKRGLCEQAIDFKWSSARFHIQNIVDVNLPQLTRPDPEWFHDSGVQIE